MRQPKVAMILAAGRGTRLGALTVERPKPLLTVGERPLIEWMIRQLAHQGVTDLVINLHYQANQLPAHLGDGQKWGIQIHYQMEAQLWGTAGSVEQARPLLMQLLTQARQRSFLLLYGDILTDFIFAPLWQLQQSSQAKAAIVVHQRASSNSRVEYDPSSGRVHNFIERPLIQENNSSWVNSGLYCLDATIFELLPPNQESDFPRDIFPQLIPHGALYALPLGEHRRIAIDSVARWEEANQQIEQFNFHH